MRHLGNLAAHAAYSVYFECLFCDVSWQGCAAAAECPVCGAGYDWNNPSAGPSWPFPHPWDLKWIWRFGDRAGLCIVPKGWSYSPPDAETQSTDWRKVF